MVSGGTPNRWMNGASSARRVASGDSGLPAAPSSTSATAASFGVDARPDALSFDGDDGAAALAPSTGADADAVSPAGRAP